MKDFYEEIDLLFFLQWPRSELSRHGSYQTLKNHPEISAVIIDTFGNEDVIREGTRYVRQKLVLDAVAAKPFPQYDCHNLIQHLPLFSNCELLYRYLRCHAVHGRSFPFVASVFSSGNKIRYQDNHAITGDVLFQTAKGIMDKLKDDCLRNGKWPWEL